MNLEEFVSLFPDAKKASGGYIARCPAHEDHTPSLSIAEGKEGILIKCFAGCSLASILATKGLKERDLFYESKHSKNGAHTISAILAQYLYHEADGHLVYRTTRHLGENGKKTFRQWRPDPSCKDGFRLGLGDIKPILYKLPQLIEATSQHHTVYIAEGEKDVDCLGKHGFTATCNTGGAGKWRDTYNQYFAGANVVVIADKDDPGRKHALAICHHLYPIAASVKYLELPGASVKDAHDYFAAGATARQLVELTAATPGFDPNEQPTTEPAETGYAYPPLRWASDSVRNPEPLREPIIHGVLRRRDMMVLSGPSKSHKSWNLLAMAICIAAGIPFLGHQTVRNKVLYVNCEIHSSDWDDRLNTACAALGVDPKAIEANLAVLNLRGFNSTHSILLPHLVEFQKQWSFGIILIDPSYFLYDELLEENSNADITRLLRGITQFSEPANFATAFAAHFAKGNAAARTMIDRTAGASAWARYPDCLLMLTPLDEESKRYGIEFSLRAHPKIPAKIGIWEHPLLRIDHAATEQQAIAALRERAKSKSGTLGRRILTLEEYMSIVPKLIGHDVTKPRNAVISGSEERLAIQKLGYHPSQIKDIRELALQKGLITTVTSTLMGRQTYIGEPQAIELWKPHLELEDAKVRAERERAKSIKSISVESI